MSHIDRALLRCSNPLCDYMAHESPDLGTYCCRWCHKCDVLQQRGEVRHGRLCAKKLARFVSGAVRTATREPERPLPIPWSKRRKRSRGPGEPESVDNLLRPKAAGKMASPPQPLPLPFWRQGDSAPVTWARPHGDATDTVSFKAVLIGQNPGPGSPLPIIFYFDVMGSPGCFGGLQLSQLGGLTPSPFVLVAPMTPVGNLVVLDDDESTIRFETQLLCDWMQDLSEQQGVDRDWISAWGFSDGAYALCECLATLRHRLFRSVVLGGLPGVNACWNTTAWSYYLERLEGHVGVENIVCLHHAEDGVNDRHYAQFIVQALNQRQRELLLPDVVFEEAPVGYDSYVQRTLHEASGLLLVLQHRRFRRLPKQSGTHGR